MDDLFFQMKLAETAKHLHVEVKVATNPARFCNCGPASQVCDCGFECQQRTTASGSTTREPTADLADHWISLSRADRSCGAKQKAAGFQQVMPRSQFTRSSPILAMAKD